jgi:hypothetical protein
VPFFIEGEQWPQINKVSMTFLCQFIDPSSSNNILYRIFVYGDNFLINFTKIEFSEENKRKQIILKRKNEKKTFFFKPYNIDNWEKKSELISYKNILNILNLNDNLEIEKRYEESKYYPSDGIKIGGTPQFIQKSPSENYDFLQLTETNILRFKWGELGIAHFSKNGKFYYDYLK